MRCRVADQDCCKDCWQWLSRMRTAERATGHGGGFFALSGLIFMQGLWMLRVLMQQILPVGAAGGLYGGA